MFSCNLFLERHNMTDTAEMTDSEFYAQERNKLVEVTIEAI
jgi:hypothetical protein